MKTVAGVIVLLVGVVMLLLGPRFARARISLHFSTEDMRATSGPRYRLVRRTRVAAYIVNEGIAAFWLFLGVRFLAG